MATVAPVNTSRAYATPQLDGAQHSLIPPGQMHPSAGTCEAVGTLARRCRTCPTGLQNRLEVGLILWNIRAIPIAVGYDLGWKRSPVKFGDYRDSGTFRELNDELVCWCRP